MGFDVGNFISGASKGIIDRAVSGVKGTIDSTVGGNKGYTDLASSILSSGSSLSTLESIASLKFDSLLDKISDQFFAGLKGSISGAGKGRTADIPFIAPDNTATSIKYPTDLSEYSIAFQFEKYRRPVPLKPSTSQIVQTIYLPLPRELTGSQQMNLDTPSTGILGSVVDAASLAGRKGVTGATLAAGAIPAAIAVGPLAAGAGGIIGSVAAMAAVTGGLADIESLVEQTAGATPNPNLSVAYKGPTLRTFSFSWEFSPNNPEESKTLQKIIEEIQKRSLAAYTIEGSSAFLSYPETVLVKIYPDKGDNAIGKLLKFKKAMISSIQYNTSPNGIPSFFKGTQAPTFISLNLSIQEIEYFVSSDYDGPTAGGTSKDLTDALSFVQSKGVDALSGVLGTSPPQEPTG